MEIKIELLSTELVKNNYFIVLLLILFYITGLICREKLCVRLINVLQFFLDVGIYLTCFGHINNEIIASQ